MATPAANVRAQTALPERIGRFEPLRVLGKGGQGVVYLARDPDLDREVAIKTLFKHGNDPQRLVEEARKVARLQHANIVPLYEIGLHEGAPFLVYQFIPGRSLRERVADGALPIRDALEIARGVLDGIGHAHANGIIHRDLSPANVLIDASGTPKILDFGVATLMGDAATQSDIAGTVNYLAPEYLNGGTIGPAADVFSVATILYEALTGRQQFSAANHMAVIYKIVHEQAVPPSLANRQVDAALDAIVMKGLAKLTTDRYGDANAMRAAITEYLEPKQADDSEIPSGNDAAVEFLLRRMRRNPDFPATSQHIAEISSKSRNTGSSHANELANVILKDYALTGKLLRLVNSAIYGQYGGEITTISRAVLILGFEQVRMAALSLALFDHLKDDHQAGELKSAVLGSFLSGSIARALCATHKGLNAEETFISALFHRLGKMLVIYYFPQEYAEIRSNIANKKMSEAAAVRAVLGVTYPDLGVAVGREWKLPENILGAMRPPRPGEPVKDNRGAMLATVAALSNDMADIVATTAGEDREAAIGALVERYKDQVALTPESAAGAIERGTKELREYAHVLNIDVDSIGLVRKEKDQADAAPAEPAAPRRDAFAPNATGEFATAALSDRRMVLVNALTDITNALLGGSGLNDVFMMILEALYRGAGFSRVLFCARDPRQDAMIARFGFGPTIDEVVRKFRFRVEKTDDIFSTSVRTGRDCAVLDTLSPNLKYPIPEWCRALTEPRSLLLFPLAANRVTVALIYADQVGTPSVLKADDLRLIKALVNQGCLAVQRNSKR